MAPSDDELHPKRRANPDAKRPAAKDKECDALVAAAWEAGWWCERAGNEHVKCYPPNDKRMVPIPNTPSDWRTVRNKRAQLRRSGLAL